MIRNKGGGSEVSNKLIAIIGIVIVVIILIFAILKFDLPTKIRDLLPDYSPNQEDKEINQTNDTEVVSQVCKGTIVGKVVAKDYNHWYEFYGATVSSGAYIYVGNVRTDLLWISDKGLIELDEKANENVGSVNKDKKISISDYWMTDTNLRAQHPTIPSVDDLKILNGASIEPNNIICK